MRNDEGFLHSFEEHCEFLGLKTSNLSANCFLHKAFLVVKVSKVFSLHMHWVDKCVVRTFVFESDVVSIPIE